MADLALGGKTGTASAVESDFSPRKIKIATVILLGQTFASSILPFVALVLALLPGYRFSADIGAMPAAPKPRGSGRKLRNAHMPAE